MKRLEIETKENRSEILQTRVTADLAKVAWEIVGENEFRMSDVLRAGLKLFIAQYGSEKAVKALHRN